MQIAEAAVVDPALARRLAIARAEQRARARGEAMDAAFTQSARKPSTRPASLQDSAAPPPQDTREPLVPLPPYEALAKGHATGILVVPITR
jgi:hypothetical protein